MSEGTSVQRLLPPPPPDPPLRAVLVCLPYDAFRNRQYDPATGRWLQEDPIGLAGGVNLYQYTGNNPASFGDPFGLMPDSSGRTPEESDTTKKGPPTCYERNRLSSVIERISGSKRVGDITEAVGNGSILSLGLDIIAIGRKSIRTGLSGSTTFYASGVSMIGRPLAQTLGRKVGSVSLTGELVGAVNAVGDKVTPTLAVIGAGTLSFNSTTDIQCRLGIIK